MHFAPDENLIRQYLQDEMRLQEILVLITSFTQNIVRITGFLKFSPDPLMNPL